MPVTVWEWIGMVLLIVVAAILAEAFLIEKFFIQTRRFYIHPATRKTDNIKIVQISDLHIQSVTYQLKRSAKKLNRIKPQLLVITGDTIDKVGSINVLNDFLQLIDINIQKAAILGNWEYQGKVDLAELKKTYALFNCQLLVNESARYLFFDKTVTITGMDDLLCGKPDFKMAIKDYQKSDYHILLAHCPRYYDHLSAQVSDKTDIDFILAGHTHGGQVTFFGYIPYTPKGSGHYVKGWYNDHPLKLYVSKGIGTVSIRVRFGARPEMTVFNLSA